MRSTKAFEVAICGAGLAGLSLAISLHSKGISSVIYDAAERPQTVIKGSVNLAPNGQAVLDDIGVLHDLLPKTGSYRDVAIRNNEGKVVSRMLLGHKDTFGYDSIRVVRADLIDSLVKAVHEKGISIVGSKRFKSVLSESDESVTFSFEDGTTASASMLIGADGIFSHVRAGMYPDFQVKYIGHVAVLTNVDAHAAQLDDEMNKGMTLGGEIGAMLMGPNAGNPSDWILVIQQVWPDLGKEGWKQFGGDKEALQAFMLKDHDKWPAYCQRALNHMEKEALFAWPMYTAPPLPSWSSPKYRILLIGDAAHAMPPSGGQGASMAFEDSCTLALVLEQIRKGVKDLGPALEFWENLRKERVQDVIDFTAKMTQLRAPGGKPAEVFGDVDADDARIKLLSAIYGGLPPQKDKIESWAEGL